MSEQELYMMSEEKAKVRMEAEPTPNPVPAPGEPLTQTRSLCCWGWLPCATSNCCLVYGGSVVHIGDWNLAICPLVQNFLL